MANQSIVKIEEMDASDKGKKEKATGYYKTWFGTTSAANVAHVKGVFQAVLDVFDRREDYTVRCNPPECAGEFAHTHTGWDYIAVCDAYFESKQAKYNDTMPGIILHELTHSAGHTDDHAYGQADAKKLATSNVPQAIDNADNYEYFAENLP